MKTITNLTRDRRDRLLDMVASAPLIPRPTDLDLRESGLAYIEDDGVYATEKGKTLALATHF